MEFWCGGTDQCRGVGLFSAVRSAAISLILATQQRGRHVQVMYSNVPTSHAETKIIVRTGRKQEEREGSDIYQDSLGKARYFRIMDYCIVGSLCGCLDNLKHIDRGPKGRPVEEEKALPRLCNSWDFRRSLNRQA